MADTSESSATSATAPAAPAAPAQATPQVATTDSTQTTRDAGLQQLYRYRPLRELGRGTYGRALLVIDTATSAKRALKYVDLSGLDAPAAARAANEAALLRELRHPGIVPYYESFLAEGRLCIVTAYAEGGTPTARHQKGERQALT